MKENQDHTYWRSFEELHREQTSNQRSDEFAIDADQVISLNEMTTVSRRRFLALLGASAALAGTGCTDYRGHGKIVSWTKQPEGVVLGRPNFYASTCSGCEDACGTIVKTREGRPIKIDGNPDHPVNRGKICDKGQASVLSLYDPERIRTPMGVDAASKSHSAVTWDQVGTKAASYFKPGSKKMLVVTHTVTSPSMVSLLGHLRTHLGAEIVSYEQFAGSSSQQAWKLSYGQSPLPVIQFSKADLILAVESDLLADSRDRMAVNREIAARKDGLLSQKPLRLIALEGDMSMTGGYADQRIALRPDMHPQVLLALLGQVLTLRPNPSIQASVAALVKEYSLQAVSSSTGLAAETITGLAADLTKASGKSLVHVGAAHSVVTHLLANLINEAIGARALWSTSTAAVDHLKVIGANELGTIAKRIQSKEFGAIVHLDCNPAYDAPSDSGYKEALSAVEFVLTFTQTWNETARLSHFVLPDNHDLESWGDYQTRTGLIGLQQPVIASIYDTRQAEGCLLSWVEGKAYTQDLWHDYIRARWESEIAPSLKLAVKFNSFWNRALHDGYIEFKQPAKPFLPVNLSAVASALTLPPINGESVLVLRPSYSVGDGRFAHNGWLQEKSHPVSRITWDNYVAISPAMARSLGVTTEDNVSVACQDRKVIMPIVVQPGLAKDTIVIELGYGREASGAVATGVGFNANVLLSSAGGLSAHMYSEVVVKKAAGTYELASIQDHHQIDLNVPQVLKTKLTDPHLRREVIAENTLAGHLSDPEWLARRQGFKNKHVFSIYKEEQQYPDVKWGMSIDLNKCSGCGVCVVACSSENNIPVVGKEQVRKGREMHWLRIDRYYSGPAESPKVSYQPMLCQHCDNAPCENVCPVGATTHSPEGLNDMAYNRCVGTRYCANNCPYKVRRFNFYDFRASYESGHYYKEPMQLSMNPEVTVRSRGVMEKCTFCVQRIMDGRQEAKVSKTQFTGSGITTACQDACPTSAIQFGNVNQEGPVVTARSSNLSYHVLQELNVKPNVTYLARLRNQGEEVKS